MKKIYSTLFFLFLSFLSISQSLTSNSKDPGEDVTSFGNEMKMAHLSTTSVKEISFTKSEEVRIVPNPVIDKFKVKGSNFEVDKIEMFNLIGEKQTEKSFVNKNSVEMDVKDLRRGIYYVKLFSANEVITKKIILK